MLENTFCHMPGLGLKRERQLWESGISTWDDFLAMQPGGSRISARFEALKPAVLESQQAFERRDADFFAAGLPRSELWRLYPAFSQTTAYVDIETTGCRPDADHITSIALYDGREVRTYVHGRNLERFADDILAFTCLVTFNGSCFDIPILERELQIAMPKAHIDLRFVLRNLGYRGGLKSLEKQFGLDRGGLAGVDGYTAVLLWEAFERTAQERFLETLLAYNAEDVLNLEQLLVAAVNRKLASLPLDQPLLAEPFPAVNPHQADARVLEDLLAKQTLS